MNRTRSRGSASLFVLFALAALAGAAGILSVAINSADNRHTLRTLADPETTDAERAEVTDEDIERLRAELGTNLEILTAYGSLGTATLPSGESAGNVAGSVLTEQTYHFVRPAVVGHMADPGSSWNEGERPSAGTRPTGGEPGASAPQECTWALFTVTNATGDTLLVTIDTEGGSTLIFDTVPPGWTMSNDTFVGGRERAVTLWARNKPQHFHQAISEGEPPQRCWGPGQGVLTCAGLHWTVSGEPYLENEHIAGCPNGF